MRWSIQTILGRSPAEVCVTFQEILQQIIGSSETTREAGVQSWPVYFIGDRTIDSFIRIGGSLWKLASRLLVLKERTFSNALKRNRILAVKNHSISNSCLLTSYLPSLTRQVSRRVVISSVTHVVCKSPRSCKAEGSFSQANLPSCCPCRWLGNILRQPYM